MTYKGRVDGVVFYGVPVLVGTELQDALLEIEREIHPPSPEELLMEDWTSMKVDHPSLVLARKLRAAGQDPHEPIPNSELYLGIAGDSEQRLYFLSDVATYVPCRHLISVRDMTLPPKKLKERFDKITTGLLELGITKDVGPIDFYVGAVVWPR